MTGVRNILSDPNDLLASEPCLDFNVQYFSSEFDKVGDIQYYNVTFRKSLILMTSNVCNEYIWCKHVDIQVVILSMTSKRGRQCDSASSYGGNVRTTNISGARLENILEEFSL